MNLQRRTLMTASVAAAVGAGAAGRVAAQKDRDEREIDPDDTLTEGAPSVVGDLKRFSTTAFGAEMTGAYVMNDGTLFHSVQHPHRENPDPWNKGGLGYYREFQFEFDGTNDEFEEPSPPSGEEQDYTRAAEAEFEVLIQEGDEINGGTERWG
ncbi:cell surface protein, partial [Halobacteriales archaeon QH_7_69_31]